jgi:hypothetical protein
MADQTHIVCDGCHLRPAVHHIHYAHTGKTRHSCQVCYDQFPSPEELAFAYTQRSGEFIQPIDTRPSPAPASSV